MRPTTLLSLVLLLALAAPTASADAGESPTAREIMELVDARDTGDNSTQDMEMILIDKNGSKRERKIRALGRDVGEDTQSIMFFLSPADVKDTGFLTYDYDADDKDDDQWLYLPALKKTKRIASNDKSGSFMGSDFSYSDMTDRKIDRFTAETRRLVDVLTWRAVLLVAVVFGAAIVFRAIPYRVKASKEA